jgi:hypothetical protein
MYRSSGNHPESLPYQMMSPYTDLLHTRIHSPVLITKYSMVLCQCIKRQAPIIKRQSRPNHAVSAIFLSLSVVIIGLFLDFVQTVTKDNKLGNSTSTINLGLMPEVSFGYKSSANWYIRCLPILTCSGDLLKFNVRNTRRCGAC